MKDPIVEEVRKARGKHSRNLNYDIRKICEDLRNKEKVSDYEIVSFEPKRKVNKTGS